MKKAPKIGTVFNPKRYTKLHRVRKKYQNKAITVFILRGPNFRKHQTAVQLITIFVAITESL